MSEHATPKDSNSTAESSEEHDNHQTRLRRRHRRHGGAGGHHLRTKSLVDNLTDVLEVLMAIDEVEAQPVTEHNDPQNRIDPNAIGGELQPPPPWRWRRQMLMLLL